MSTPLHEQPAESTAQPEMTAERGDSLTSVSVILWAIVAGVVNGFFVGLDEPSPLSEWMSRFVAETIARLYAVAGLEVYRSGYTVTVNGFSMSIAPVSLAGRTLAIVCFPLLLYPSRFFRKLGALLCVVTVLCALNFLRLALLGYLGAASPRAFELMHLYVYQIVFIAAVILGSNWAAGFMDRGRTDEILSTKPVAGRWEARLPVSWASVFVLSLVWVVGSAGLWLALGALSAAAGRAHTVAVTVYGGFAVAGLQYVLGWWVLGAVTLSIASNRVRGRAVDALHTSFRRLPDIFRAAVYCSIWIGRPPTWPWSVHAAIDHPEVSGRAAYLEGKRLADRVLHIAVTLTILAVLIMLGLPHLASKEFGTEALLWGHLIALPLVTILWALTVRTMSPLSEVDLSVFD